MASKLQQIVDAHRKSAAADKRDLADLVSKAESSNKPRDFVAALRAPALSVIAEVKRRSPSMGDLNVGLDPATLAENYADGGASCVSVLTDEEFFGGSVEDLRAVRARINVPVLRKDFTVDQRDIADARIMGADAVLLIVAILSDDELRSFQELAKHLGLAALVEVHNEQEIERAHNANAGLIGVNQRNLNTFELDPTVAARLRPLVGDAVSVAESAITSVAEAHALFHCDYDAILMGTALVTHETPTEFLREIVSV